MLGAYSPQPGQIELSWEGPRVPSSPQTAPTSSGRAVRKHVLGTQGELGGTVACDSSTGLAVVGAATARCRQAGGRLDGGALPGGAGGPTGQVPASGFGSPAAASADSVAATKRPGAEGLSSPAGGICPAAATERPLTGWADAGLGVERGVDKLLPGTDAANSSVAGGNCPAAAAERAPGWAGAHRGDERSVDVLLPRGGARNSSAGGSCPVGAAEQPRRGRADAGRTAERGLDGLLPGRAASNSCPLQRCWCMAKADLALERGVSGAPPGTEPRISSIPGGRRLVHTPERSLEGGAEERRAADPGLRGLARGVEAGVSSAASGP
mmetsp:Transcript_30092/g.94843  ORF Transcript_30092/g.94843 Transcript_30092/m.94843 type:complete len:325 (-) Transcript_30092:585-1559(-)